MYKPKKKVFLTLLTIILTIVFIFLCFKNWNPSIQKFGYSKVNVEHLSKDILYHVERKTSSKKAASAVRAILSPSLPSRYTLTPPTLTLLTMTRTITTASPSKSSSTLSRLSNPSTPSSANDSEANLCKLPGRVIYDISENVTASEVLNESALQLVTPGGGFEPRNCTPRDYVAIIVPYRNRSEQLMILLNYLHNFLQLQSIKYDIYVIEPVLPIIFNRGILCNIGFKEAIARKGNYTCIIIHDVDQLPLNLENHYICDANNARHLASESSKNSYKLPYYHYIGGVVAVSRKLYEDLNGFSNVFFGWGGEDDDLSMRIQVVKKTATLLRPPAGVGRYISLPHDRDKLNPVNPIKFQLYKTSKTRFKHEGLNTLKYKVLATKEEALYTWIQVHYNESQIMQEFHETWRSTVKPTVKVSSPNVTHNKTQ